ncbi:MAG: hypothetical protein H7842_04225 [Gammaproteobacteria bacterium SHHR-1]|uniref:hypothetical protein n=1 Tax=Magnetovirga frankeli TaxID=947516 RepID=UPI001292D592|nr:hypothetical protein D5125_11765 [gamma proteobacterium SS-5]
MAYSWTVWDYLTLAVTLLVVLGYVLLRIKEALDGKSGCNSCCSGCGSNQCPAEPPPNSLRGIEIRAEPLDEKSKQDSARE